MYTRSLTYVNDLYNKFFGKEERVSIAHVPILINKNVLKKLHNTFYENFQITSSRKFRSSDDMQFEFS